MRSCIYCGRELEKGEVCSCPQSAAHRAAKQNAGTNSGGKQTNSGKNQQNGGYSNPFKTDTSYRTGYTGKESRFERVKTRYKTKRAARKSAADMDAKGFFRNLLSYVIKFLKAPMESISNPGYIGKGGILSLSAVTGALLWLCVFFILRGGAVGPFKLLASLMSFNGSTGFKLVGMISGCILSGAIGGIVIFFLYSGIFYMINKFIMRVNTAYWQFCIRLISAWIPFTFICLIGTVISILSPITLAILVVCGAVTAAVMTYEALRIEWISQSPSKVLYSVVLGYFVFFVIMSNLFAAGIR